MALKVTWYGHSVTLIESEKVKLLVDPFFTGNAKAAITASDVSPDVIALTHGHGDHVGDTVSIAKRTGAQVVSCFEVCNWIAAEGVENVHPLHIGGGFDFGWGRLQLTIAHHGSSMPDGSYGGNPAGLLLTLDGKKIYHAGDTGLFYDMKLIGDHGLDLAIVPIGDNFTMGPDDALRAVELLRPGITVPIHFDTFDVIEQDPGVWAGRVKEKLDREVRGLQPGESLTL